MLQQGNFKGHMAIAGSPAVAVDWGTRVKVGGDATVTADGYIDFSLPPGSGNAVDLAPDANGESAKTEAPGTTDGGG